MYQKKILARAVAAALAASAFALASGGAWAQSNTTGSIYGNVGTGAGATVVVENVETGLKRTVTPEANGRFQAISLPPGSYKVQIMRGGAVVNSKQVEVTLGQGAEVLFTAVQSVESVKVTSSRQALDVQNTNSGPTFTAKELAKLPIAQSVAAVIQLAPGTVAADTRYGGANAPSFGGASGSENSYYINGFPVTNPLTQTGFSSLPFGAIGQAQILSGGYGAEFGRATGGVVNITTKSGTNTWEGGVALQYEPDSLRSTRKNIVYPNVAGSTQSGRIRQYLAGDKVETWVESGYMGGPIVKDKLFIFLAAEETQTKTETTRSVNTDPAAGRVGWDVRNLTVPRLLGKLDWNITDNHRLEYTAIRDNPKDYRKYYGFDYATLQHNNVQGGGATYRSYGPTPLAATTGGDVDIVKYAGTFFEDLTVTALWGKTVTRVEQNLLGYNPNNPLITVSDPAPSLHYTTAQSVSDNVLTQGASNKSKGYRFDAEYRVNDRHTVRAGLDNVELRSYSGTQTPGGKEWRYSSQACGEALAAPGAPLVPSNLAANGTCYYVYSHTFKAINPADVDQSAMYIEDRWQVTDRILLSLGLRSESFKNFNDRHEAFVKQDNQIEPRIGAAWDVTGDSKFKVFGTAGRYHLQLPANVAIRGAGASTFVDQYFSYTGVDQTTGAPTGLTALTAPFSPDGETGLPKDLGYVAAKDLKSHFQDEFSLGFEKSLARGLNVGAKGTYRRLKNTLEDWCDPRPFVAWAAAHHVGTDKLLGTGAYAANGPALSCATINPGYTNTFDVDLDGDGKAEHVVLSPRDMAGGESTRDGAELPKAKRTYVALDLFAEHPFDGTWYGRVNYTWSKSRGNTEGQLNSDLGQADPAATIAYDFKELMEYSNGKLPNDRTHVIKAFGYWTLTPEWTIGSNLLLASGRPKSCLGAYPDANNLAFQAYGRLFRYCNGQPSPRGAFGNEPWQKTVGLNVSYRPQRVAGLQLKMDVFNLFNSQTALQSTTTDAPTNRFQMVEAYTAPRYVRFTVQYDFKL